MEKASFARDMLKPRPAGIQHHFHCSQALQEVSSLMPVDPLSPFMMVSKPIWSSRPWLFES